jgi:hypothetical protein
MRRGDAALGADIVPGQVTGGRHAKLETRHG